MRKVHLSWKGKKVMFFLLKAKIQVMRQTGSKWLGNDVQGCTTCSTSDKSVLHRIGGKKEVVDQALTVETKTGMQRICWSIFVDWFCGT